jgi:O-antigen ligase
VNAIGGVEVTSMSNLMNTSIGVREDAEAGKNAVAASVVITTIAIFGPYTPLPGIRTEQLVVYGLFVVLIPLYLPRIRFSVHDAVILAAMGSTMAVASIIALFPLAMPTVYFPGSVWAGLDSFAMPIAIMFLVKVWLTSALPADRILRYVIGTVMLVMVLNAILTLGQVTGNLTPLLAHFWAQTADASVALRSAQMGRLTGIFNQPSEAGVLYGLAMFAAVYLLRARLVWLVATLALLAIGGLLTVSKLFILIALPLVLLQLMTTAGGKRKTLISLLAPCFGIYAIIQIGLLDDWQGQGYLSRLADPTADMLTFYSGGRFGEAGSLGPVVSEVWRTSPLLGVGLSGLQAAYDNAWVEWYVLAGITGVVCYTAVLAVLIHAWLASRRRVGTAEAAFSGVVVALVVVSSLGLPVLTANRTAATVWIVLCLTVLAVRTRHDSSRAGSP